MNPKAKLTVHFRFARAAYAYEERIWTDARPLKPNVIFIR